MKKAINKMELLGFTIWVSVTLVFTVIICQYILPEGMKATAIMNEIIQYRSFFKRLATVIFAAAIFLSLAITFWMCVIVTEPKDFINLQGKDRIMQTREQGSKGSI